MTYGEIATILVKRKGIDKKVELLKLEKAYKTNFYIPKVHRKNNLIVIK